MNITETVIIVVLTAVMSNAYYRFCGSAASCVAAFRILLFVGDTKERITN